MPLFWTRIPWVVEDILKKQLAAKFTVENDYDADYWEFWEQYEYEELATEIEFYDEAYNEIIPVRDTLQHAATHCNTPLQSTTHCNADMKFYDEEYMEIIPVRDTL